MQEKAGIVVEKRSFRCEEMEPGLHWKRWRGISPITQGRRTQSKCRCMQVCGGTCRRCKHSTCLSEVSQGGTPGKDTGEGKRREDRRKYGTVLPEEEVIY